MTFIRGPMCVEQAVVRILDPFYTKKILIVFIIIYLPRTYMPGVKVKHHRSK